MASPPGGQYLFTANSGATPVNLVLTANGTTDLQGGALAGDTISGAFNLEVFVGPSNPGGATTGYQASAFAPGATVLNGFLVTPSVGGSLHFNGGGPLAVTDYGFADSIFGGTANDTIHAGVKDTIIGGASSVGSLVIDATKIVNAAASVGGSDLVALGGAASTVYAAAASGAADTVNAGSGTGVVTFGTSGLTLQGAAAGTTYAIADTAGGALSGGALHISVGGSAGDTISLLPGNASVTAAVNALAGSEQVNLGAGAAAVYAVAGDTINAGAGIGTLTFGPAALGAAPGGAATISGSGVGTWSVAGPSVGGAISGTGTHLSISGAAGDTITTSFSSSVGSAVINALNVNSVSGGEQINLGGGFDTVYAVGGDTINAGAGVATLTFGTVGGAVAPGGSATINGAGGGVWTVAGPSTGGAISGTGSHLSITGAAGDTISASFSSSVGSAVINALNVNSVSGGEQINLGGGFDTVYAVGGDTINAGAGVATLTFGTVGGAVAPGGSATINGIGGGVWTVAGASAGGAISGTGTNLSISGAAGDTIATTFSSTVGGAKINALSGGELINLGAGGDTVYAVGGDTINAGAGTGVLTFGPAAFGVAPGGAATISGGGGGAWTIFGPSTGGGIQGTAGVLNLSGTTGDTITSFSTSASINAFSGGGNEVVKIGGLGGALSSQTGAVFGGNGDSIGIAAGTSVGGSETFTHSSVGGSVGFGTFNATSLVGSQAHVTVSGFDSVADFVFYQNESAGTTSAIVAAQTHPTASSTQIVLPDGTTMLLLGVTSLTTGMFK